MTFQIFNGILNHRVFVIAIFMMASVNIHAQQSSQDELLNLVAKLKRIEAMQPDSVQPKYQLALQSLSFAVTYPHAPQTENMILRLHAVRLHGLDTLEFGNKVKHVLL